MEKTLKENISAFEQMKGELREMIINNLTKKVAESGYFDGEIESTWIKVKDTIYTTIKNKMGGYTSVFEIGFVELNKDGDLLFDYNGDKLLAEDCDVNVLIEVAKQILDD